MASAASTPYTPPLGHSALTPLYDAAIAMLTRERIWRTMLVGQIDPRPDDRILDIGCGTGTLALALHRACPTAEIAGIDPDPEALDRARAKASAAKAGIAFFAGFFGDAELPWTPNKIVSSLVFHQIPLAAKRALFENLARALPSGGSFHLADYSRQDSLLMRAVFRASVQMLDGRADTQPNADGVLETLMRGAGFDFGSSRMVRTPTGAISLYEARRSGDG